MKKAFIYASLLLVGVIVFAAGYFIVVSFKGDDAEQPLQGTVGVFNPLIGITESDQLIERIIAFETAYNSIPVDDSTEKLVARITPYTSEQFLSETPLDKNSGADIAFRDSGHSIVAQVAESDIDPGEIDDPGVVYPFVIVHMTKFDIDGQVILQYPISVTGERYWRYDTSTGWMVYPLP